MSEKTPLDIAKEIADSAGNNFHSKVAKFFRDKEWKVLISPYYIDPSTDKPREIDIIAEKLFIIMDRWNDTRPRGYVRARLHIECKYIIQPTVFWFDDQDVLNARAWVSNKTVLKHGDLGIDQHHYLNDRQEVAKLFATQKTKEVENEPMFKAINQTLNGLLNNRGGYLCDKKHLRDQGTVDYPVIVCSSFDRFFRKRIGDDSSISEVTDNFLMEVNYAVRAAVPRNEYFLIDVLEFNQLDEFLRGLDIEFSAMHTILRHQE